MGKTHRRYRCGKCGNTGHNARSCGTAPSTPPRADTSPQTGHKRPLTPLRDTQSEAGRFSPVQQAYGIVDGSEASDSSTDRNNSEVAEAETLSAEELFIWWELHSGGTGEPPTSLGWTQREGGIPGQVEKFYSFLNNITNGENHPRFKKFTTTGDVIETEELKRFLAKFSLDFRRHVAMEIDYRTDSEDPNVPYEVVVALAADSSSRVREHVALNKTTPGDILVTLASDRTPRVVKWLSENRFAPAETFTIICGKLAESAPETSAVLNKEAVSRTLTQSKDAECWEQTFYNMVDSPHASMEELYRIRENITNPWLGKRLDHELARRAQAEEVQRRRMRQLQEGSRDGS